MQPLLIKNTLIVGKPRPHNLIIINYSLAYVMGNRKIDVRCPGAKGLHLTFSGTNRISGSFMNVLKQK